MPVLLAGDGLMWGVDHIYLFVNLHSLSLSHFASQKPRTVPWLVIRKLDCRASFLPSLTTYNRTYAPRFFLFLDTVRKSLVGRRKT